MIALIFWLVNTQVLKGSHLPPNLQKHRKDVIILLSPPFFGKISVNDDETENFYLGLQNIKQGTNLFVVDWRAPICSLYYYGNLGPSHYTVNGKDIQTNLTLKRQFEIENGKIMSYFDADEKVAGLWYAVL